VPQKRLAARDKDDRIGGIRQQLAPFLKLSSECVKQFEAAFDSGRDVAGRYSLL